MPKLEKDQKGSLIAGSAVGGVGGTMLIAAIQLFIEDEKSKLYRMLILLVPSATIFLRFIFFKIQKRLVLKSNLSENLWVYTEIKHASERIEADPATSEEVKCKARNTKDNAGLLYLDNLMREMKEKH